MWEYLVASEVVPVKQIPYGDDNKKSNSNDETQIPFPPQPAKALAGDPGYGDDNKKSNSNDETQIPLRPAQGNDKENKVGGIDRTVKQYIGGKQVRPDSGYSYAVYGRGGERLGEAPLGSRKDIRNAVEAARNVAAKWAATSAHGRAQVLYFIAENLTQRSAEIAAKLAAFVGTEQAEREVQATVERTFAYGAWADKFEGSVHQPATPRMIALAMKEAIGTIGVLAPEDAPLLGLMSLVLPCVAMGNAVVAVPSERAALLMGELYQVFDTSDLPGGVVNLVAGKAMELGKTLAEHDDVDAVWSFCGDAASAMVKAASIGNLKQVWTGWATKDGGQGVDWFDAKQGEGRVFLRHATQVKNIWVPYGE
jgi:aldehyde dehydrogenase (NAD+)